MNLRKIWLIARREYLYNFRRRSFLFTAFIMPLVSIGITVFVISVVAQSQEDISAYKHVGIVDKANVFVDESGNPVIKLPAPFQLMPSDQAATTALKSKAIDAYYGIPVDFLHGGRIDTYHRPDLTISDGLQTRFDDLLTQALASRVGDATVAQRLQAPIDKLSIYRLGSDQPVDKLALIATIFVPFAVAILMFMTTTVTSQFLMAGLTDEKENRMMEMFITSVRPTEILWGKILGLGALGLTQMLIWAVAGAIYALTRGSVDVVKLLSSLQLTPGYFLLLAAYFVLGYLSIASIMFGIGASVNAEQESRQLGGLLSLLTLLPLMLSFSYFVDPNGPLPTFMSLFPLTSPVGMILRAAWTSVPPAQIALSLVLLALTVFGLIWLAARIFRLGLLNYGKRLGLRDIIRSIREGRRAPIISARKEATT